MTLNRVALLAWCCYAPVDLLHRVEVGLWSKQCMSVYNLINLVYSCLYHDFFFSSISVIYRLYYYYTSWSNIEVVKISLSCSNFAPLTSLTAFFSDVQCDGRKLEQASSVGCIICAHLYAFATSSEQKKARPSSTNRTYFTFCSSVTISLLDSALVSGTSIGLYLKSLERAIVYRFFKCLSLN